MSEKLIDVKQGEALAYWVPDCGRGGWAFAGDYFHAFENGLLVCKQTFASGAIRFERHNPVGWAVIRGIESIPLVIETAA